MTGWVEVARRVHAMLVAEVPEGMSYVLTIADVESEKMLLHTSLPWEAAAEMYGKSKELAEGILANVGTGPQLTVVKGGKDGDS